MCVICQQQQGHMQLIKQTGSRLLHESICSVSCVCQQRLMLKSRSRPKAFQPDSMYCRACSVCCDHSHCCLWKAASRRIQCKLLNFYAQCKLTFHCHSTSLSLYILHNMRHRTQALQTRTACASSHRNKHNQPYLDLKNDTTQLNGNAIYMSSA